VKRWDRGVDRRLKAAHLDAAEALTLPIEANSQSVPTAAGTMHQSLNARLSSRNAMLAIAGLDRADNADLQEPYRHRCMFDCRET
jgi:hypothetical protein